MFSRRQLVQTATAGTLLAVIGNKVVAQHKVETASSADIPPQVQGLADFSGSWVPDVPETTEVFAGAPELSPGTAERFASIKFTSYSQLEDFFRRATGTNYIDWFNHKLSKKGAWTDKEIGARKTSPAVLQSRFQAYWSAELSARPKTLLEFIAYMAIFTNECGGNLASIAEQFEGYNRGFPGVSYLYDQVPFHNAHRSWQKRSYNGGSNWTAYRCFNDPNFNAAHSSLKYASNLSNTNDQRWAGVVYPTGTPPSGYPTGRDCGFIFEADFCKFRGRGLIQTTWRENYKQLVRCILSEYTGNDGVMMEYRRKWQGLDLDQICTRSTNRDWDRLFSDTNYAIICEAVFIHAKNRYMPLGKTTAIANADVLTHGSLAYMGATISGGYAYAALFKARVKECCDALLTTGNLMFVS